MKKARIFIVLLAIATLGFGAAQAADRGSWQINVKALGVLPSVGNDANEDADIPEDILDASDEWTPELDIKYFFNEKWAIELVLAYPEHDVEAGGDTIGTVTLLPPTISVQYHFGSGRFQPYLGAGVNITTFSSDLPSGLEVEGTSFGPSVGAGFNFFLGEKWLLTADVKYAMIGADLEGGGEKLTSVDIDPWLVGVGVGYRF